MKLGIAINLPHDSAEEWAKKHSESGLESVVFPCDYKQKISKIDEYVSACHDFDLTIAEVGAWRNVLTDDSILRQENLEYCKNQLELADYVKAKCCVNISGAKGDVWDAAYADNYSRKTYSEIVESVQWLIDEAKIKNTFYTLEPMPWMYPDTPESYLQMIKDIDREHFAVHMDMVNMISDPKKYLFNKDYTNKAFDLLGPYIKSCHIKDVALANELTLFLAETPPGEGGFDLKNYITQINSTDKDMPVIIEHLSEADTYIKAVDYLKSLM